MPHRVPREAEEVFQMRKDNARCGSTAIPLTPQPLSLVGARGAESNLISILFTAHLYGVYLAVTV